MERQNVWIDVDTILIGSSQEKVLRKFWVLSFKVSKYFYALNSIRSFLENFEIDETVKPSRRGLGHKRQLRSLGWYLLDPLNPVVGSLGCVLGEVMLSDVAVVMLGTVVAACTGRDGLSLCRALS